MLNAIAILKVWEDDFEVIDFIFPKIDERMKELETKLASIQKDKKTEN